MQQRSTEQQTKGAIALQKLLERLRGIDEPTTEQQQQQSKEQQSEDDGNTNNDDTAAHVRLARLLITSGRREQAAKHCSVALQLLDQTSDSEALWKVQFELAQVLAQLGVRDRAIMLYYRILETQRELPEAHVNLAAQLMVTGELDSALKHLDAALAIAPHFPQAHYNKNVLLRRVGRQTQAVELYWALINDAVRGDLAVSTIPQSRRPALRSEDSTLASTTSPVTGISVLCVKSGTKYGAEYVNKLFASIRRNIHRECSLSSNSNSSSSTNLPRLDVEFVCLTDDPQGIDNHDNVRCFHLKDLWKNWWSKLALFSPFVTEQLRYPKCVYLDLDTVIVGSLDALLRWDVPPHVLALLKTDDMANEQRIGGYNSSVMMWRADRTAPPPFQFVHEMICGCFQVVNRFIYKFDHWLEMTVPDAIFIEDAFPGAVVEYNQTRIGSEQTPPPGASVVCFPLEPKPHNATAHWVKQYWSESSN